MKGNLHKHLLSLIALSVLIIFAVGSTDTDKSRKPTSRSSHTWGYKLAVIDGKAVSEDETIVTRYNFLLNSLSKRCNTTKEDIADAACSAQNILKNKYGRVSFTLDILELANKRIPEGGDVTVEFTKIVQILK